MRRPAVLLLAAALTAVGVCAVLDADARGGAPTYHGAVGKILRKHCTECHHPGDVGPFALDDAAVAALHADDIVEEIESGRMPPWRPTRGIGKFVGERGVSPKELETLRRWRDAGAPAGTPRGNAKPVTYPEGWVLGDPDAVVDYGTDFPVQPGGDDVYRCFPVRNPFGRDVWISGIDVQPGARSVVHHVVLYVDSTGETLALDAAEEGPGYTCFGGPSMTQLAALGGVLGGWAPGNRPQFAQRGTAMFLGKDDVVVVQCHYHNHDPIDVVPDRTRIGLHESDEPEPASILLVPVMEDEFTIPAGADAHVVERVFDPDSITGGVVEVSGHVHSVLPHMHLLGRRISLDLLLPDATEQRLVEIADWDFDWQDTYTFARPVPVPPGSKMRLRAVYDNSEANPRNPHRPPQAVSHGERTTDEMCLVFMAVTVGPAQAAPPPVVRSVRVDGKGRLVVAAKGLGRGGRLEIAGVAVADAAGTSRLRSASAWAALAPSGEPVEVRVRRADGRVSRPVTFTP